MRCRRLAAAVTDLAIVAALTAAIVTASAALAVDAASAFAGAIIARLGPQRIGRLLRCTIGKLKALNYILQGTTAPGAPHYKAESDDGAFYYLYPKYAH